MPSQLQMCCGDRLPCYRVVQSAHLLQQPAVNKGLLGVKLFAVKSDSFTSEKHKAHHYTTLSDSSFQG